MSRVLTPQEFLNVPLNIRQLAGAQSGERSQNTVILDPNSALAQAKNVVSGNKQNYGLKSKDPRYLTQRIENSYKKGSEYTQFNGDVFQTYGLENFKTTYSNSGVQANINPYVYKKKIYFNPGSQIKEVKSFKGNKMVRILDKTGRPYLITNKKIRKIFGYVHPIIQLITAHNQLQSAINRYNLYVKSGSEQNYNQFLAVQSTLRKMGQPAVQMSQYLKASGGNYKQTVDQLVANLQNQVNQKVEKVQNFSNQQIAKIKNKPNKVSALIQGGVQIPVQQYALLQAPIMEQIEQEMQGEQDAGNMANIALQKATSLAEKDGVILNKAQTDFLDERLGQLAAPNTQFAFNQVASLAKTTYPSFNQWLNKAGIKVKEFYTLQ